MTSVSYSCPACRVCSTPTGPGWQACLLSLHPDRISLLLLKPQVNPCLPVMCLGLQGSGRYTRLWTTLEKSAYTLLSTSSASCCTSKAGSKQQLRWEAQPDGAMDHISCCPAWSANNNKQSLSSPQHAAGRTTTHTHGVLPHALQGDAAQGRADAGTHRLDANLSNGGEARGG